MSGGGGPAKRVQRRLAAILAADAVGYSRMMGEDEEGTWAAFAARRTAAIEPAIAGHGGRAVKFLGDGVIAEFPSVVDAVRCAVELQRRAGETNESAAGDRPIEFRIGVSLGDVIAVDGDVFGDGVNLAARLESVAPPGGIVLSDDAWRQVRGKVDVGFEDLGRHSLKNIAEPVRLHRVVPDRPGARIAAASPLPTLPDRPSIAVLPFRAPAGDPEQQQFADGLTEDIITSLSKIAGLFVISRTASFGLRDPARDLRSIAAELGVRHVLDGSLRAAAGRVRISAEMIDARDGGHVWAERYDRVIDDVFALQDEITLRIATELQVHLTEGEQARLRHATTSNVEAWTAWVQGLGWYRSDVSKDGVGRARMHWERALRLDPQSAVLNAMLGLLHWASARFGWWDGRGAELSRAKAYVDQALALDPEAPDARWVGALVKLASGDHDAAVEEMRKALDLAPGSADIAAFAALVFNFAGRPAEALVQVRRAMRLSPIHPAWYLGDLGFAHRLLGQVDEAIAVFREYGRRSPGFGHVDLAIVFTELGRPNDAKAEAECLLAARPSFTVAAWRRTQFYRDSARLEADSAALRSAGLP